MVKRFIIADEILFNPQENTLSNVGNLAGTISLNVPTAKCLELLLTQKGVVTHQELYDKGWGTAAQEPLPNTLYQNILLIRQALRKVSDKEREFIITVPRKGFVFNENIKISILDIEENDISPLSKITHDEKGDAGKEHSATHRRIKFTSMYRKLPARINITMLLLSFLLVSFSLYLLFGLKSDYDFDDNFLYFNDIDSCKVYVRKPSLSIETNVINADKDVLQRVIETSHSRDPLLSCQRYPYRFISLLNSPSRIIMIACRNNSHEKTGQRCISAYIRGKV